MRILVIRHEPPWPLHFGGKLHAYELCRRLAERHELLLAVQHPGQVAHPPFNFECCVAPAERLCAPDVAARGYLMPAGRAERFFGFDPAFYQHLLELTRQWCPDVVIGMGYLSLSYLARIKGVPTICDLQDDEALHRWRELLHGRMTGKWKDLKCLVAAGLYEWRLIPKVGAVTVLSKADAAFCRRLTGHPRIECIPHGVDCDYYRPVEAGQDSGRIIFWGGLDFGPNVSAILFFAEKVWPLVRRERPGLRWTIVGGGSPSALEPARRMPGIEFTGYVEDIRPHVAEAAVAVVPMVSGAGIKNKIMEAWAMGKATLCTPLALGDLPGEHGRNVWLAAAPRELAQGLLTLLSDADLRRCMGQAARWTAVGHCSWDDAVVRLEWLCRELKEGRASAPHREAKFIESGSGERAFSHAAP